MSFVFIAGGTGYMGQQLTPRLLKRNHRVRAMVRPGSENKVPAGCEVVRGDPLNAASVSDAIAPSDTYIHLVGVAHPSPNKSAEFLAVDLKSVEIAVPAAAAAGIRHFIYVSVAHPAPIMKAYIDVRRQGEQLIRESGMNATILRPWYVLGPGHRWPLLLKPVYYLCEHIPSMSAGAKRLGLVTISQMIASLTASVEQPPSGIRVMEVPEIKARRLTSVTSDGAGS
jgi:uncharacterized protein YbjT (DUF2867 family)